MWPASLADARSAARPTPPPKSRYTIPGDNDIVPAAANYGVVSISGDDRATAGAPAQIQIVVAVAGNHCEVSCDDERMPIDQRITTGIPATRSGPVVDDIDGPFGVDGLVKSVAAEDLHLHAEWQVRVRKIRKLEERIVDSVEGRVNRQLVCERHHAGGVDR